MRGPAATHTQSYVSHKILACRQRQKTRQGENNILLANLYYNVGLVFVALQNVKRARQSLIQAHKILKKSKDCVLPVQTLVLSALDNILEYEYEAGHEPANSTLMGRMWANVVGLVHCNNARQGY